MPLTTRAVSPTDLSLHRLSASVQRDELQCVANGTLANLIRQLSSLSRNAEQLFSEIHRETLKIDHKTNTLFLRVERLAHKITQAEFKPDTGSLEENNMRKAFKSCNIIDQHSLDRQTLPNSLYDLYQKCDAPPQLDHLNPYRDDSKSALRYYTDPSYFFDLWKQEMLKECSANADRRAQRSTRSPTAVNNKSPSRRRKQHRGDNNSTVGGGPSQRQAFPHQSANVLLNHYSTGMQATSQQRYMGSVGAHQAHHYTQGGDAFLHFPAEYQAPQNAQMSGRMHAPPGMSMHPDSQQQAYNSTPMPRPPGPASQAQQPQQPYYSQEAVRPFQAVQPQTTTPDASYSLQKPLQSLSVNAGHPNFVLEEDDDELPPPPPVLSSHTMGLAGASSAGLLSTSTAPHPTEETMQYLPSGAGGGQKVVQVAPSTTPMPPPPPPAPPMAGSLTVASFGAAAKGPGVDMEGAIPSIDGVEGSQEEAGDNQISNLLMEIQSGIKLKKVQRQVELAEAKAALQESNDVAAILRRRMEHVLGNDDGSSGSGHSNEDDGEWD